MPRKICKEKNVSSKRKHREGKSRFKHSRKYSDIPASIDIGVKNVKRWNALKVVCSFETDAEFAEYLLRLAENKIRKIPHKHENNENEKSVDFTEKDEGHKKKAESLQHNSVRFKTKRHRKEHKNSHHSRSHKKRHSTEKNHSSHKIDKSPVVTVSENQGDKSEIDGNCELVKSENLEIPNGDIKSSEQNKISVETGIQNNSGSIDNNVLNSSRCSTSCNEFSSDQKCTNELDDIHHQTVPNLVIEKLDLSKINVQNYFQNKLNDGNSVDISKCANVTQPLLENNILSDNCNLSNIETLELKKSNKTKKPNQDIAIEYDNIKDKEVETERISISNSIIKRKRKKEKHSNESKHKKKIKNHDIRKAPQLEFNSGDAPNSVNKQEDEIDVDEPKENHENNPSVRVAIKIKLCYGCNTRHLQDMCPLQNPLRIVDDDLTLDAWNKSNGNIDIKTENSCDDSDSQKSYAIQSLPSNLYLEEVDDQHGLGVFSKCNIEKFTRFGPLIGKLVKEVDIPDDFNMKHIWEVRADNHHMYINTENMNISNWIRYMRPAETRDKRVLTGVIVDKELYFITIENITASEELRYWIDEPQSVNRRKSEKTNCGGCNLVFEHTLYYRTHCSVFHDSRYSLTIRKYHCKVCGQAVLGKDNIVRHAAELHNGQGAYQCQFCKKFFLRLNYLEMHRTYGCAANPHRSRPLCDFCGQKFCQPQKLKVHIKRMHSDISLSEFQCPLCLKLLGSRAAVQRHAREVHRGAGLSGNNIPSNRASTNNGSALACMRCGKLFQNKSNLKIHMLTHSGVKPFKCKEENCTAAFTTKQCLQFHYKKVHGFAEDFMPTIERSVEYTFAAYSGGIATEEVTVVPTDTVPKQEPQITLTRKKSAPVFAEINNGIDGDDISSEDKNHDEPPALHSPIPLTSDHSSQSNQTPPTLEACVTIGSVKSSVMSKGSKKWLGNSHENEQPTHISQQTEQIEQSRQMEQAQQDIYNFEEERKTNDKAPSVVLDVDEAPENNRTKFNMCLNVYSSRHDSSNASLLVEAALDSVSDIHITTESNQTCSDGLVVSNLYPLTQHDNLTDVNYNQNDLSSSERDINLISPSVNDHISVTDHENHVDYSSLQHDEFSTPSSPSLPSHLIHEYTRHDETRPSVDIAHQSRNNYSLGGEQTQPNDHSPSHSPPRYDFSQPLNTDTISNDSDGVVAQNLTINAKDKERLELDFSCYKSHYNDIDTTDLSIRKYDSLRNKFDIDTDDRDNYDITIDVTDDRNVELRTKQFSSDNAVQIIDPYPDVSDISDLKNKQLEQENDLRSKNYDVLDSDALRALKYDLDSKYELEIRNKSYDALEADDLRSKTLYESNLDIELRTNKSYNLLDNNELRNKAYDALLESEFRTDRAFEPLILNPTELQGLDMSARSYHGFHSGTTVPRYHIYSEPERESVPYASSADVLRVVSLDLTSQTRHGLHGLHAQLPNTRLLSDHSALQHNLTTNRLLTADHNRLSLDQTPRLLSSEHNLSVALLGSESRLLSDHTANRILSNDQLSEPRLVSPDAHRILSESSRLPNRGYSGYSMSPASYHPPTISSRSHIGSPTHNPSYHHYSGYY